MTIKLAAKPIRRKPRRAPPEFYFVPIVEGWVPLRSVRHPETGEVVRPSGPRRFINKAKQGRSETPEGHILHGLVVLECAKLSAPPNEARKVLAVRIAESTLARPITAVNEQQVLRWLCAPTERAPPWTKTKHYRELDKLDRERRARTKGQRERVSVNDDETSPT